MRVGRLFIGIWLQSVVGWNWWRQSAYGYRFMAFGIGEIRWGKQKAAAVRRRSPSFSKVEAEMGMAFIRSVINLMIGDATEELDRVHMDEAVSEVEAIESLRDKALSIAKALDSLTQERETTMEEETLLMLLRYDEGLGLWVVDEDSVHHLEDFGDAVELEIAVITPLTRVGPFVPQDPAEE